MAWLHLERLLGLELRPSPLAALAAAVGVGVQARFSPRRLDPDGAEQEGRAHVA